MIYSRYKRCVAEDTVTLIVLISGISWSPPCTPTSWPPSLSRSVPFPWPEDGDRLRTAHYWLIFIFNDKFNDKESDCTDLYKLNVICGNQYKSKIVELKMSLRAVDLSWQVLIIKFSTSNFHFLAHCFIFYLIGKSFSSEIENEKES